MTIEEAIEVMKNAFIECIDNHTELNVVDANADIQNALKELQWYREQDLIDRKGMKNRIIELVDSGLIRMYTDVLDAIDEYPKVART